MGVVVPSDVEEVGVVVASCAVEVASVAGTEVVVASVVVATNAETMPVLKMPIVMTLARRTLAAENAITLFFIPDLFYL